MPNAPVTAQVKKNTLKISERLQLVDLYGCNRGSLCGLVFRVPGYRSRGQCSIPGAARFTVKQWVWNGIHSAS
jgi:hypothetical protein